MYLFNAGDWNDKVDENDSKKIWDGCCSYLPSLKNSKIINRAVGLRPGRSPVRYIFIFCALHTAFPILVAGVQIAFVRHSARLSMSINSKWGRGG